MKKQILPPFTSYHWIQFCTIPLCGTILDKKYFPQTKTSQRSVLLSFLLQGSAWTMQGFWRAVIRSLLVVMMGNTLLAMPTRHYIIIKIVFHLDVVDTPSCFHPSIHSRTYLLSLQRWTIKILKPSNLSVYLGNCDATWKCCVLKLDHSSADNIKPSQMEV